jgi:hypothetical protein
MMLQRTMIILIAATAALMPYASLLVCACTEDCSHCSEQSVACHTVNEESDATPASCCSAGSERAAATTPSEDTHTLAEVEVPCACSHQSDSPENMALLPSSRTVPGPALLAIVSKAVDLPLIDDVLKTSAEQSRAAPSSSTHLMYCVFLC